MNTQPHTIRAQVLNLEGARPAHHRRIEIAMDVPEPAPLTAPKYIKAAIGPSRKAGTASIDPLIFASLVATATQWISLPSGTASFGTHKLQRIHPEELVLQPTETAQRMAVLFIAVGTLTLSFSFLSAHS